MDDNHRNSTTFGLDKVKFLPIATFYYQKFIRL